MITKHVYQKDHNGCAVAAVAMLANVDYFVARRAIFPKIRHIPDQTIEALAYCKYDEIPPVEDKELLAGMRRLGLKIRHYEVDNLSVKRIYYHLKHDALFTMKLSCHNDGYTHCYAWDAKNKKLYDPAEFYEQFHCFDLNSVLNVRKYKIIHVVEVIERSR